MNSPKPTKAAIYKLLILGIIYESESYGYDLIYQMKLRSEGNIIMKEGTLYPLLKNLTLNRLIRSAWKKTLAGNSRKYYSITESGKLVYKQLKKEWQAMNVLVEALH